MKTRGTTSLVAVIAIILSLGGQAAHAQKTGDSVELEGATAAADMVPVCTTTQAVDEVIRALADDDNDAIAALAALGKVYGVDVGTKAIVLGVRGQYGTYVQIRILDGEFKGRQGYVVSTCIGRYQAENSDQNVRDASKIDSDSDEWKKAVKTIDEFLGVTPTPTPTPTPKPIPAANANQAAGSAKEPVTAAPTLARSRPGVTVWRGWLVGLDGNYVRGQYARLPDGRFVDMSFEIQQQYNAQHGIQRPRKSKAELEAYRSRLEQDWDKEVARREKEEAQSDQDKARELYLQKRLGRPPGAHWGIEEDEFWRHVLGLDHE